MFYKYFWCLDVNIQNHSIKRWIYFQSWHISGKYLSLEELLIDCLNQKYIIYGLKIKSVCICVKNGGDFYFFNILTECLVSGPKTKSIQLL